jgi:hypothetical protein
MNHNKPTLALILFVFLVFSSSSVFASSMMWNQTYGTEDNEVARWVIETTDNGYALGGYTRDVNEGEEEKDFLLIKVDSNGIMEWNKTIELKKYDSVGSIIETSDRGYALAGGLNDCWLIKTDSNGIIQWNKTYGSGKADFLIETADSGYAFCGSNQLVKTDSEGNMEWTRKYGGERYENLFSLTSTSDGGFALVGNFFSVNSSNPDFWLVRTDRDGNLEWSQTYDYKNWWEHANFVEESSDGGYVIAGIANFPPPLPVYYFWLIKTDTFGNMEWNKTFGESEYEQPHSIVRTSDGGFAICGSKQFFDHGYHHDFWLIKTNADGNEEWSQTYGESSNEIAYCLIETSDGGYALAGESYPLFGAGDSDFWLIKTDELGNIPEFPSTTNILIFILSTLMILFVGSKFRRNKVENRRIST